MSTLYVYAKKVVPLQETEIDILRPISRSKFFIRVVSQKRDIHGVNISSNAKI